MATPRRLRDLRELREVTAARIGLERSGASLGTRELLSFDLDHARARDAVHLPFDAGTLLTGLAGRGLEAVAVNSQAADRGLYLQRPDLGRRLHRDSAQALDALRGEYDLAFVIADGLSTRAVHENALALLDAVIPMLKARGLSMAPVVVASQGRVALGDAVGERLGARLSVMLIGERPGLSSADSLGVYLTFDPKPGRRDSERNCISNIRPAGLRPAQAAHLLFHLATESLRRRLSGVALKDDRMTLEAGEAPAALPAGD